MKKFEQGELNTAEEHTINSLIMERASEIADALTRLECKLNNIVCDCAPDDGSEGTTYTDEAQDIFNVYYDEHTAALYDLLDTQLDAILPMGKGVWKDAKKETPSTEGYYVVLRSGSDPKEIYSSHPAVHFWYDDRKEWSSATDYWLEDESE